jgi:hypothetical protein
MLLPFGPELDLADGPDVSFHGFPYPTRMAVVRLSTGRLWVWSPIALTDALAAEIDALGPIGDIVSPNKLHHLFLAEWSRRWPGAHLHAPPGLARKRPELRFASELSDEAESAWRGEIDQTVFRGSPFMEEVVFFHRASQSAIFGDLIQRFPERLATGWKGQVLRVAGLVGAGGSTPIDWRLSFVSRRAARAARRTVLGWHPERLVIAHGDCAARGASAIVEAALRWM